MPLRIIYLVAFLEWFSTLAVEIVAMRIAIPVVGSSIVLTSVFLWVVLLALSAWYRSGGVLSSKMNTHQRVVALGWSLLFAGVWYLLISFAWERQLLEFMIESSWSYLLTLFVVAWALFFLPVFVASHTIPLLTDLLDEPSKGKAAGVILFASTVGSFFGSTVTSIILFEKIWVSMTWVLVWCWLIFLSSFVLYRSKKKLSLLSFLLWVFLSSWYLLNQQWTSVVYSFDSAYQQIEVYDAESKGKSIRVFSTNGAYSSAIYLDDQEDESPFKYINEILRISDIVKPKKVLIIGAAWFVYPQLLSSRQYVEDIVAVDIDPSVKRITEEYFFNESLESKIEFIPRSARGVIYDFEKEWERFDLIFLDAYNDKSVPEELVSLEFFEDVSALLTEGGVIAANMILDPSFESDFSQSSLSTMGAWIWSLRSKNVTGNPWSVLDNVMVLNREFTWYTPVSVSKQIYTDDRSRAGVDNVKMLYLQK